MDSGSSENSKIGSISSDKGKYKITVEGMKAKVWKYFDAQKKDYLSFCKECKAIFYYFNTTEEMRIHMLEQHADVLKQENDMEGKLFQVTFQRR